MGGTLGHWVDENEAAQTVMYDGCYHHLASDVQWNLSRDASTNTGLVALQYYKAMQRRKR